MTSTDEARRAVRETIEHLGGLDIIIANAGWTRFSEWKDLDSMSEEEWDKCWNANVKVPKALLTEARSTFEANAEGGHMITTGSIAACWPFPLRWSWTGEQLLTKDRLLVKAVRACPTQ
jgi:[acyl-carrier-protein] S-malonyltransferase